MIIGTTFLSYHDRFTVVVAQQELKKIRAERPRISDQFADLKANLASVSYDEWSAIPEIGDYTIKHRNRKTESNSAVPDSVLGTLTE